MKETANIYKETELINRSNYCFCNGAGNRVAKITTLPDSVTTTNYVRDASGNVLAVYSDTKLKEQAIYGSSRLGQYTTGMDAGTRTLGYRHYELNNHLGNVLAVITDNIYFAPDSTYARLVSTSDYYPFGLDMPGCNYTDTLGNRSLGEGTHYDYGFRIYNPKVAKFLSVDPLTKDYPMLTPYQFASNTPIAAIDIDGLEAMIVTFYSEQQIASVKSALENGDYMRIAEIVEYNGINPYFVGKDGVFDGSAYARRNFEERFPNSDTDFPKDFRSMKYERTWKAQLAIYSMDRIQGYVQLNAVDFETGEVVKLGDIKFSGTDDIKQSIAYQNIFYSLYDQIIDEANSHLEDVNAPSIPDPPSPTDTPIPTFDGSGPLEQSNVSWYGLFGYPLIGFDEEGDSLINKGRNLSKKIGEDTIRIRNTQEPKYLNNNGVFTEIE